MTAGTAIGAAPATSSVFQFCFPAVGLPGEMDAPLAPKRYFLRSAVQFNHQSPPMRHSFPL